MDGILASLARSRLEGMGFGVKELYMIRHILMSRYGWIPEKEFFEETSISDVVNLLTCIAEEDKRVRKHGGRVFN